MAVSAAVVPAPVPTVGVLTVAVDAAVATGSAR